MPRWAVSSSIFHPTSGWVVWVTCNWVWDFQPLSHFIHFHSVQSHMLSADLAVDNSCHGYLNLLLLHTAAIISVDLHRQTSGAIKCLMLKCLHWIPLWSNSVMVWVTSFTDKIQTTRSSSCQPSLIYPIPVLICSLGSTNLSFFPSHITVPHIRVLTTDIIYKEVPLFGACTLSHILLLAHPNTNFRPLLFYSCAKSFPLGGTWLPPSKASLATCQHSSCFSHHLFGF